MAGSLNPPGPESASQTTGSIPAKTTKKSRLPFYVGAAVLIVLLTAIALPNFVKARTTKCTNACNANLRQMRGAIENWALENKKAAGSTVTLRDISGDATKHIKGLINADIKCPSGGTYVLTTVDANPTCSTGGTHVLEDSESK